MKPNRISIFVAFASCILGTILYFHSSKTKGEQELPKSLRAQVQPPPVSLANQPVDRSQVSIPSKNNVPETIDATDLSIPLYRKAHPAFKRFAWLEKKALRSEAEELEFKQLLSDSSLQDFALQFVSHPEKQHSSLKLVQRLIAIDYLGKCLQYRFNPYRDEILDKIQTQLTLEPSSELKGLTNKDILSNWMGDQAELMMMALTADLKATKKRVEQSADPMTKKIYEFALNQLAEL